MSNILLDLNDSKLNLDGGIQSGPIKDITTASFQNDVLEASRRQPVLVDFWAPWCEPCKQLAPILERTVASAKGAVTLVKMNIEDHPTIAGQLGIQSIPAVVAFVDGKPVDAFMGVVPETEIKAFVDKFNSSDQKQIVEDALDTADQMIKAGDILEATELYSHVLQSIPDNIRAIAGLSTCFVETDEIEQAKAILETTPADKKNDPLIGAVKAKIALIEKIKILQQTVGDEETLKKHIEKDAKDYQARFDLALILNAHNNREAAVDALLDIMKDDRQWNDDGARKQLLQFFEAWGTTDGATLSGRRKLSSLLFS